MAATHDVSGHALLTRDPGAALDAHTEVAERVLGIVKDYTGTPNADVVKSAIALQVSHQVKLEEDNAFHLNVQVRGKRRVETRGAPTAHPLATELVSDLVGAGASGWNELRSLR